MILTKEQIQKRVSSDGNILNQIEKNKETQVSIEIKDGINNHIGNTGKRLTEEERIAIGLITATSDSKTAAEMFGVHPSHANDLRNGNRNSGVERVRDTQLINKIEEKLERTKLTIEEIAADKLMKSLGFIDDDKLENASLKEIADVTTKMSQVVRNISQRNSRDSNNNGKANVKIVLHQPKTLREDAFDTIEIGVG